MISILDRWLLKEVLAALGMILAVVSIVLVASNLVRILGKVAAGGLDQGLVFILVGLEFAKVLGFMLPPVFFLAVLLVLARLYNDSEMAALRAAGVSPVRVFRAISLTAVPLAVLVTWLVMQVLPWAKSEAERRKLEQVKIGSFKALRSGNFNEFRKGDLVVFVENTDGETDLRQVFVQHRQHGKVGLVIAERAQLRTDLYPDQKYIVLSDGKRYEGQPGSGDFTVATFAQYGLRITAESTTRPKKVQQSAKSWRALMGSPALQDRAEFQYRLAFPLAVFALLLVAMPLAHAQPRRSLYGRLAAAVLVYFIFMNLLRAGQEWMEEGLTPAWLGVWWVPASLALLAFVIWLSGSRWMRRLRRPQRR